MEVVSNEALELTRVMFRTKKREIQIEGNGGLDVRAYLNHYRREIVGTKQNGASTLYCLKECVFDPSHAPNEAAIGVTAEGKKFYQCFHESCKNRRWADAREKISGADSLKPFMSTNVDNKTSQDIADKEKPSMLFTKLRDLFQEKEDTVSWLVDEMLPMGGFSILAGKPKGGKTTLARNLSLCVTQGKEFLGRETTKGSVLYLALEEKRAEVKKHFRDMGATGNEDIHVFVSSAPVDALNQIREKARELRPALVIIDPLFRFTRVRDSNDYAQVTQALEPLLMLARETEAHVLVVHHASKGEKQAGDSILGSTAIFGSVDTAMILKRGDKYRTISTIQRYGKDLEETTLHFDTVTRTISIGKSKEDEDISVMEKTIFEYLHGQEEPLTEQEVHEAVEGRKALKVKALRSLVDQKRVTREGKGGKSDPYKYSCSLVPVYTQGTTKQESENVYKPLTINDDSCSGLPAITGNNHEQENEPFVAELEDEIPEIQGATRWNS